MRDLISRQLLISKLANSTVKFANYDEWEHCCDVIESVEREKGEWIKCSDTAFYWMCSECGAYLFWRKEEYLLREEDEANFCPNCGADMRGEKDE